ncbi:MAG: sporulation initiation factor Spo0A C-terminal domain-containing protein [Clostridia bacterium]|nr:sporulation initiation factor Spo0A C-terminal domain-containing protein [Clostridia bacterium]
MVSRVDIARTLLDLGLKPRFKGFGVLIQVLLLTTADPSTLYGITTVVYPTVAQDIGIKAASVERNIRTALLSTAFRTGTPLAQKLFYDYDMLDTPTNSEFISIVTLYLLTNIASHPEAYDVNQASNNM